MSTHVKPTKIPQERDFTGGMIHLQSCSFIGSTGEKELDDRIVALATEISGGEDNCLLAEMLISAIRIARGAVTEGDFKTMNRALREMRIANEVFILSVTAEKYPSLALPVRIQKSANTRRPSNLLPKCEMPVL